MEQRTQHVDCIIDVLLRNRTHSMRRISSKVFQCLSARPLLILAFSNQRRACKSESRPSHHQVLT
jgi:hypothetical protein